MSMLRGFWKEKNSSSICIGCSFFIFKRESGEVFIVYSIALAYNKTRLSVYV